MGEILVFFQKVLKYIKTNFGTNVIAVIDYHHFQFLSLFCALVNYITPMIIFVKIIFFSVIFDIDIWTATSTYIKLTTRLTLSTSNSETNTIKGQLTQYSM